MKGQTNVKRNAICQPSKMPPMRSATECCEPEPIGSIRSGMAALGTGLDCLSTVIDSLRQRLTPVIQDHPSEGGECGGPACAVCPVGEDVRQKCQHVETLTRNVQYIIEHLDI